MSHPLVNVFEWKNPKGRTLSPIANKFELLEAFGTNITSMMMMMMLKKKNKSEKTNCGHQTQYNGKRICHISTRVCMQSIFFSYYRLAFPFFGLNRRLFLYLPSAVKYAPSWWNGGIIFICCVDMFRWWHITPSARVQTIRRRSIIHYLRFVALVMFFPPIHRNNRYHNRLSYTLFCFSFHSFADNFCSWHAYELERF